MKTEPNKTMQPSRLLVTDRAFARSAPSNRLADLERCAKNMRILISGGPGAGCTSTAKLIGAELGLPVFDSDTFFHKPSDPPFQEQYSPDERRQLIAAAIAATSDWILSGSIATWGVDLPTVHFGVFLDPPKDERLRRLDSRERERFGSRIDLGGDLHSENTTFMEWASGYEDRSGRGRNRSTDKAFLAQQCEYFVEISQSKSLHDVALEIRGFLANPRSTTSRDTATPTSRPVDMIPRNINPNPASDARPR